MADPNPHDMVTLAPDPRETELELATIPTLANNDVTSSKSAKEFDTDPFLVIFDQHYDAENPLDWRDGRKWMVTDVLSATGFNRIMVSTIMAPALSTIATDLDMSATESAMSLSIYLLASAFGPLVMSPLSEMYGRRVILHSSNVWFLVWNVVCGFAATKEVLIASRFLAGFGASGIYALAGGVMGDIWRPEQRGRGLGIYLLIPLLGAAVGPIIGGFIAERSHWRWIFWSTSAFQAAMTIMSFFCFYESYGPHILRRRAERLRKETGNNSFHTESQRLDGGRSAATVFMRAITRPLRLLMFHPIIQVSSILQGFNYGILYITLSTFSTLWIFHYHQSLEISGLHYIACSLGELAGSQASARLMDHFYSRRQQGRGFLPESRIPLMIPGIIAAWSGALIYGWTAEYRVHWLAVDVGVFTLLAGMQMSDMSIMAYVIDSYGEHTSSAMAAQQFVTSLVAFLFPLFAPSMYHALGYGWTNSVLALAGFLLMIMLPLFVWKYGARLRAKAISTY
ncbi:caffeine resistance protein [Histoplasma capsulatum G186AR]|uniref:Caffeine resistance protein n=2 Tax=Ajellomyces capsulatus TaxID=5037 RepID=C0NQ95_AJECG|nr:caffeine resistance protein [Histoplasma capsulatum G186AR]EEH06367.1 caffeine resistance protein [Histoplasma capsulatum G186AR]KAG5293175.1 caffeine resistance protein [Histoplasma capsulatum]QSS74625.1 caffeine resistance protein [Histoplasma capsulatum G186AR]